MTDKSNQNDVTPDSQPSTERSDELTSKGMDRRKFAKTAGLVAGATVIAGVTASEVKSNVLEKLKKEIGKSKSEPLSYVKMGGTYGKNPLGC